MKLGRVIGSIWATRKAACLQGQTFLVVEAGEEKLREAYPQSRRLFFGLSAAAGGFIIILLL